MLATSKDNHSNVNNEESQQIDNRIDSPINEFENNNKSDHITHQIDNIEVCQQVPQDFETTIQINYVRETSNPSSISTFMNRVSLPSLVPYSDTDTDNIEEENIVGSKGHRKKNKLPKRILAKKKTDSNRKMKPNPCLNKKCGNKCASNFTEDDRELIFGSYWGLGNEYRRKDFLLKSIKRKNIKRRRSDSQKKKFSYEYKINYNNQEFKVCQQFLINTLGISQMSLRYAICKSNSTNCCIEKRKNRNIHNKTLSSNINALIQYIENLPAVPSHYCRNKSNKRYLPVEFRNIQTLYRLYVDHFKFNNNEEQLVSTKVFRKIFKTKFNIGFHLPKKDKCITCEKYKFSSSSEQTILNESASYQDHIKDKVKSKEIFLEDQARSKVNSEVLCASFDLQKVLNTPHSKHVTLFYSRKYAFYNESVYESGTRSGYCFLWGETDGKRGCNEICSIMYQYLKIVDERKSHKKINLYCDSCAGQNRNKAFLCMIMYFLQKSAYIEEVKITYLLPGHTMMPVDSIHSTIESFIRQRNVWAPSEWPILISNCRTNPRPYICIEMKYNDFLDWKTFSQYMLPSNIKIKYLALRSAVFQQNDTKFSVKYGYFDESEEVTFDVATHRTRKANENIRSGPKNIYDNKLTISTPKHRDLMNLIEKNSIPQKYHSEYGSFSSNIAVQDVLPESDEEDSDQNE